MALVWVVSGNNLTRILARLMIRDRVLSRRRRGNIIDVYL